MILEYNNVSNMYTNLTLTLRVQDHAEDVFGPKDHSLEVLSPLRPSSGGTWTLWVTPKASRYDKPSDNCSFDLARLPVEEIVQVRTGRGLGNRRPNKERCNNCNIPEPSCRGVLAGLPHTTGLG